MKSLERMTKAELIQRVSALEKGAPSAVIAFEQERLNHELQVHQLELETQNRELREAQRLLEVSRNRYADLYDFAPVGYATLNSMGVILDINLTAAGILGVERTMLLGVPFQLHVSNPDLSSFRAHITSRSGKDTCVQSELHVIRADKATIPVSMQSVAIDDEERGEKVYRAAFTDISQRERAHRKLCDNEARLRAVLATAADGIITITENGIIESFNRAAETMFSFREDEVIGRNINILMPSPHREQHDDYLSQYRETGVRNIIGVGREVSGQRRDGSVFPMELNVSEVNLSGRRIFTGFVRDITERKGAEKRLREQMQRYQSLLEVSPDAIYAIKHGRVEFVNAEGVQLLGLSSPAELLGKSPNALFQTKREEIIRQRVNSFSGRGSGVRISPVIEERLTRPDGSERWVTVTSALFMEDGETVLLLVLRDITDHKRLENEILEIGDREQQSIGHELHDGLGQQLTALEMKLYLLGKDLSEDDLNSIRKRLQNQSGKIGDMVRDCVTVTRGLAQGLSTINLTNEGLVSSLERFAVHSCVAGRTACHFECPGPVVIGDSQTARHLYRIAQESVNNALKHARAKNIWIKLIHKNHTVHLQIKDDGRGLPMRRRKKSGMGMEIMRHRANLIGASLEVTSIKGAGVTIDCELSVKNYEH